MNHIEEKEEEIAWWEEEIQVTEFLIPVPDAPDNTVTRTRYRTLEGREYTLRVYGRRRNYRFEFHGFPYGAILHAYITLEPDEEDIVFSNEGRGELWGAGDEHSIAPALAQAIRERTAVLALQYILD